MMQAVIGISHFQVVFCIDRVDRCYTYLFMLPMVFCSFKNWTSSLSLRKGLEKLFDLNADEGSAS
jgi:hypothetical protein